MLRGSAPPPCLSGFCPTQVEKQTQTSSAEGVQQPFVEGDTLATKRTIR